MPWKILYSSLFIFLCVFLWMAFNGLQKFEDQEMLETVLFSIRLPRLFLASLCGASLSAAGVISQGLFRNPLASPSVLGASSGGVLGAVLVYYFVSPWYHWILLPSGAFLATLLTMFCVLSLFRTLSGSDSSHLLVCGFAITSFLGAMSSLIISLMLSQIEKASSLMQWMMGGFNGRTWEHLLFALPFALLGLILAWSIVRRLDLLSFGEELASSLNVNVAQLQTRSIFVIALLVGSSVSVAGALPFVGLIIPHITRYFTGSVHRFLLPCSMVNGMILMLLADCLAQRIFYPQEFEVGTLTSLLGVSFFFFLLWRREHESF